MKIGVACLVFFCSQDGKLKGLRHGDDVGVVARRKQLQIIGFCPRKPTEFCICLCTVIELIVVVCRRVVSEQSLWK